MRIKVILNPASRRAISNGVLRERLGGADCAVVTTRGPGDATEIARDAVAKSVAKLVVVGGDGTINEVANGICGSHVPLGIIPAGGANDFATHMGIPKDVDRAFDIALNGTKKRIDAIKVNDRHFITVGGLGFGSEVALKANAFKDNKKLGKLAYRFLGSNIYSAYAIYQILFKPESRGGFRLRGDDLKRDVRLWNLFVGNQAVLGKNFLIHPGAANDDGLLDVCIIGEQNSKLRQFATLLVTMKGKHLAQPYVEAYRAKRLTIDCEKRLQFFGDGELISSSPPFNIEIVPKALHIMVPKVT
ncbi:MAG TPA: diacylglycerol kinase family protein [Anaerolineae bacterium]|nr:diacylglycerol kinase family protein [Anaerolineae bacterium]